MKSLPVVLLLAACALPDRVGVGANAGQYDYMGAGEAFPTTRPLEDQTGEELGLSAWVEWDTGPVRPQPVVLDFPRPDWLGELSGRSEAPVVIERGGESSSIVKDTIDLGNAAQSWPPWLQFIAGLVMVSIAGLGLYLLIRKKK